MMTLPQHTEDYEKQARALLRRSNMSSGCTAALGLFGASVVFAFVLGLVGLVMFVGSPGSIGSTELVAMLIVTLICLFFIIMGVVVAGFSYSSFKANRLKAKESRRYIENYRERKAAQHGSISMASMGGEGALNMIADEDESCTEVALDLDATQDEERAHHVEFDVGKK